MTKEEFSRLRKGDRIAKENYLGGPDDVYVLLSDPVRIGSHFSVQTMHINADGTPGINGTGEQSDFGAKHYWMAESRHEDLYGSGSEDYEYDG
jgi:hypothetical protein